jgi:DMSO/TMAO reductase YedYZ molybdopterin-dependent catalytic subunit
MTRHLSRFALTAAAALLAMHAAAAQETAKGVADLEQAKREAVAADRAIRAAEPPAAPKAPAMSAGESASARFDKAVEGGFIDHSNTRTIDHYRSADGVIIERITYGGKSYCVTSGTVNYIPGILHDSSKAREVTCPPANAGWVRQ